MPGRTAVWATLAWALSFSLSQSFVPAQFHAGGRFRALSARGLAPTHSRQVKRTGAKGFAQSFPKMAFITNDDSEEKEKFRVGTPAKPATGDQVERLTDSSLRVGTGSKIQEQMKLPRLDQSTEDSIAGDRVQFIHNRLVEKLGPTAADYYLPQALERERANMNLSVGERNRRIFIAASNAKKKILRSLGDSLSEKEKAQLQSHDSRQSKSRRKKAPKGKDKEVEARARARLLDPNRTLRRPFYDPFADVQEPGPLKRVDQSRVMRKISKELKLNLFPDSIISEDQLKQLETLVERRRGIAEISAELEMLRRETKKFQKEIRSSDDPLKHIQMAYASDTSDDIEELTKSVETVDSRLPDTNLLLDLTSYWKEKLSKISDRLKKHGPGLVFGSKVEMDVLPESIAIPEPIQRFVPTKTPQRFVPPQTPRRIAKISKDRKTEVKSKNRGVSDKRRSSKRSKAILPKSLETAPEQVVDYDANYYLVMISDALLVGEVENVREQVKHYA